MNKNIKNIICITISFVLMILCCSAIIFTVNAATNKNTAQSASDELNVTSSSNLASSVTKTYSNEDTVNIKLYLQCQNYIANGEYEITYDSSKLKLSNSNFDSSGKIKITPDISKNGGDVINADNSGVIKGNYSSVLDPYDFFTEKALFDVTFDIIGTGNTTVSFKMMEMDSFNISTSQTAMLIFNGSALDSFNQSAKANFKMSDTTQPGSSNTNTDKVLGDVDLDGDINVKDATLIQLYCAHLNTLTEEQLLNADVDNDNDVNVKDATQIQLFTAHLIAGFN